MHFGRAVVAFLAGGWLYQAAVLNVGGILAAIAIPKSYFDWFGREHGSSGLALLQFAGFGLPVAVLTAGGTLAIVHLIRAKPSSVLWCVFLGQIACFAFTVAATLMHVAAIGGDPVSFLAQMLLMPWWVLPAALGPWAGFAFAAWAATRRGIREA
jgi:hypothetical protein